MSTAKGKVSQFVKSLNPAKAAMKVASEAKRTSFINTNDFIGIYKMKEGDQVTFSAKVNSVTAAVHEDGDYEGLPYINWGYVVESGPAKGSMVGNYMPMFDRKQLEILEDSAKWIFMEFQAFGYETEGWEPSDIESAAAEITKDQPLVMLKVTCSKAKTGKSAGKLVANLRLIKTIDEVVEDEESEEEEVEDEVEETEEEETDDEEVEEEDESSEEEESEDEESDEEEEVKEAPKKSGKKYKVGDKCLFTDEDSGDKVTVEIVGVTKQGKYNIESKDSAWDNVAGDNLEPAPAKPAKAAKPAAKAKKK